MKLYIFLFACLLTLANSIWAQSTPFKVRPDAFDPVPESAPKALNMATTVDQMASWDRYPTYGTYLDMMARWAEIYPELCHVDTIGTSVQGRLILSMYITGSEANDLYRPEFFYSSTMHGDEVTGFVMMLRLIDTLLNGYGVNEQYTNLLNSTRISINPLANPDGTYHAGDHTVNGAIRYNAYYVDLNRNYPDPFGSDPMESQQRENTAMISYVSAHQFRLSANLHGGSEVMNYPWDSFTSYERPHPNRDWWIAVSKRFVDTLRNYSSTHFRDVNNEGYIEGGDWYVIPNGRQDYINYYHNCFELTMEISSAKTLSTDLLPEYWRFLQHSLVNYINEVHNLPEGGAGAEDVTSVPALQCFPNPTSGMVRLAVPAKDELRLYDVRGQEVMTLPAGVSTVDLSHLPQGLYMLHCGEYMSKVVKY